MSSDLPKHKKLGQFMSTAICGNDILSSALYVSGIAAIFAGVYAPLVLLAVALVLFFYKAVYTEVVEAMPINGGAYNALLNGTTKNVAAVAGIMTILSYIATAVISAKTAVEYLFKFLEQVFKNKAFFESLIIPSVIVVLFFFAILVIKGVKDSALVASIIFLVHIISLISFITVGVVYVIMRGGFFFENAVETQNIITANGGLLKTLFLAFSASLLGVSGFESSANFVEEQERGVFPKTLRNMLIGVMVFNPLIALALINVVQISDIVTAKDFILADAAFRMIGVGFLGLTAINAFMVLCGAVLTSFVGVSGLITRMSLDEVLPSLLLKENKNGSHPRILIAFFLACASILVVTKGELLSLAGVYTISFLGVMTMFAMGNLILRKNRPELKRPYKANYIFVILAFSSTVVGILGNIAIDPKNLVYFLTYFIPALVIVYTQIYKADFLNYCIFLTKYFSPLRKLAENKLEKILKSRYYVFIHHTENLFEILNYININENGANVRLVHCRGDKWQKEEIEVALPILKKAGVFPHFNLTFEYIDDDFNPATLDKFAKARDIPKNKIFIGSIHDFHDFEYSELGGVRIIV